MEFKERLKELREEKGLSKASLAKCLALDKSTISKWELGQRDPTGYSLIILSKFFDVTAGYLLGLED